MCPKGDDPLSVGQGDRQIRVHLASDGTSVSGKLKINFLGHLIYFDLDDPLVGTDGYCQQQFQESENIEGVLCSASVGIGTDNSWLTSGSYLKYDVTFTSWPSYPKENNFFSHTGNPALESFTCDISDVTVVSGSNKECKFTDIVSSGLKGTCSSLLITHVNRNVLISCF